MNNYYLMTDLHHTTYEHGFSLFRYMTQILVNGLAYFDECFFLQFLVSGHKRAHVPTLLSHAVYRMGVTKSF